VAVAARIFVADDQRDVPKALVDPEARSHEGKEAAGHRDVRTTERYMKAARDCDVQDGRPGNRVRGTSGEFPVNRALPSAISANVKRRSETRKAGSP
jgi:hypothetical protein